jgi:hypothetical protein
MASRQSGMPMHGSDDYPVISAKGWEDMFLDAAYIA